MQVGSITVNGTIVGMVVQSDGSSGDPFTPDLEGYVPEGRASERPLGADGGSAEPGGESRGTGPRGGSSGSSGRGRQERSSPGSDAPKGGERYHHRERPQHHHEPRSQEEYQPFSPEGTVKSKSSPRGESYAPSERGAPFHQGTTETDRAITDAARAHGLDPNTMRSIASIESGMNPGSNANAKTQYKGLYQIGRDEWRRFGQGNIYSAQDNAMAAARMFDANRTQFRSRYNRDPTDTELYMMHQQGLGFYTRGAMTNIGGNPYPGMRGSQDHNSFEGGWGREVARRKAGFVKANPAPVAQATKSAVDMVPEDL